MISGVSSRLLIYSSVSSNLLLSPSGISFISLIVLFSLGWLFCTSQFVLIGVLSLLWLNLFLKFFILFFCLKVFLCILILPSSVCFYILDVSITSPLNLETVAL